MASIKDSIKSEVGDPDSDNQSTRANPTVKVKVEPDKDRESLQSVKVKVEAAEDEEPEVVPDEDEQTEDVADEDDETMSPILLQRCFIQDPAVTLEQRQLLIKDLVKISSDLQLPGTLVFSAVFILDSVIFLPGDISHEQAEIFTFAALYLATKTYLPERLQSVDGFIKASGKVSQKKFQKYLDMAEEESYESVPYVKENFEQDLEDPKYKTINHSNINSIKLIINYMLEVVVFDKYFDRHCDYFLLIPSIVDLAVTLKMDYPFLSLKEFKKATKEPKYTRKYEESEKEKTRLFVMRQILKSFDPKNHEHIVFEKYNSDNYDKLSAFLFRILGNIEIDV